MTPRRRSFNPSRDDHGRLPFPGPHRRRLVSIPPGMITDHRRHARSMARDRVSIPPGMITDRRVRTWGPADGPVSIPPGMITDRISKGAQLVCKVSFNPSRDDHGRWARLRRIRRSDVVSIPPGMITDRAGGGPGPGSGAVSIPPGMITDVLDESSRLKHETGFNPSRDDHGPPGCSRTRSRGIRCFNPSRDDHGRDLDHEPRLRLCRFNPSRDDHGLPSPALTGHESSSFNPSRDDHGPGVLAQKTTRLSFQSLQG